MEKLQKNVVIQLTITELISDGSGLGHYGQMPIFVPNAAVGDRLSVKIVKVLTDRAYGIIMEILTPSPDRIIPDCPVWKTCGGCDFRHISYEAELRAKEQFVRWNVERISHAKPEFLPVMASPLETGYRNKAQYPIRTGADGKAEMGFFAKRSHRIVPCNKCKLQPAIFGEICDTVLEWIESSGAKPYDEVSGKGQLRHLYMRESYDGHIMVCLITSSKKVPFTRTLTQMLTETFPMISSILLNINRTKGNVILGDEIVNLWGEDVLQDKLCGVSLEISPLSFLQVNRTCTELLYGQAAEFAQLTGNETVLDLYCGAGTIGLSMADKAKQIIGVEIVPQAIENAKINAARSGYNNAEFICADAFDGAAQLKERGIAPDVVILDPPRKGCSEDTLQTVADMTPERIVMISCNSATMARDIDRLAGMGYTCTKVRAVDMFPRTHHVEAVCLLIKNQQ